MPNVIEFHPERNDDDWRNRVQELLKGGYGQFRFQKVDGSIRELMCTCLLYTSPSPRDRQKSRMPSSA